MGMVANKRPGITRRPGLRQKLRKTIQDILAIIIIYEYLSTLYPPDHDVM